MRWQLAILVPLLIITRTVATAAECEANVKPYVDKEFVIVKFTPSFKEATQSAAKAAAELGVGLKLRGLSPDLRTGLTFSKEECARIDFPYPCYVPRGRRDDGTYVSVEWSSEYELFARGKCIKPCLNHCHQSAAGWPTILLKFANFRSLRRRKKLRLPGAGATTAIVKQLIAL